MRGPAKTKRFNVFYRAAASRFLLSATEKSSNPCSATGGADEMSPGDRQDFGPLARAYTCRPSYPDALFDFLASKCRSRDFAWDCATGNGQAARSLASRFAQVVATDLAPEQIAVAKESPNPKIEFR